MNSLKVLLTGANGMVGKNIIETKLDHVNLLTPRSAELNLLDSDAVNDYIKITKPDLIIHAAGIVGGIQANINHPVKFLRENTVMAHNIIWASYENNIKHFINLGSSCMYPKNAQNPLKEEMILTGTLEPTNEGYALAKIFAQRLCQAINKETNTNNYKTYIPCNLYGKYDKFDAEWGHMIPSVIKKIYHAYSHKEKVVSIWGDGTARREFMFATDLADFIWFSIDNLAAVPELINVGLGYDFSINEYYNTIAKIIGYDGEFTHDLSKPTGMTQKLVDISMQQKLGWQPKTNLETGIDKTFKFYKDKLVVNE
jgi:GDP-L-fucose synthase